MVLFYKCLVVWIRYCSLGILEYLISFIMSVTCEWLVKYIFIIEQQWLNWLLSILWHVRNECRKLATTVMQQTMWDHRRLILWDDVEWIIMHSSICEEKGFNVSFTDCVQSHYNRDEMSLVDGRVSLSGAVLLDTSRRRKWYTPSNASHTFSALDAYYALKPFSCIPNIY